MSRIKERWSIEDPWEIVPKGLAKLYSIWAGVFYRFAAKGRNLSIHFTCSLSRWRSQRISLGNDVSLRDHSWLNVADNTLGEPLIVIDDNSCIGSYSIISARNGVHVERDVLIAQSVLISDHNHAYEDPTLPIRDQGITEGGKVRICQGCWIGHGAAIICSKGELVIGRNSVIGANAVVMRSIPPYSVVAGIPARVVRQFDPVKKVWVLGSSQAAVEVSHGRNELALEPVVK